MADEQHEPFVEGVHAAENLHTLIEGAKIAGEAITGAVPAVAERAIAVEAFVLAATPLVLQTFGVTATAEDKLPPGHGEGVLNHSTSVPASDPHDPSKVPSDNPQTSHEQLMSHAPEVSTQSPLMSQDPQTSHSPQLSDDPQMSGGHQDPQMSGGHQGSDPQMSHAPDVSTHNPDAAPDPGYHH